MTPLPDFPAFFHALWNHDPFPWQSMLAERVSTGPWPEALDLPTATGKTACIDIAVYALAAQADVPTARRTAPRRTWFVVDRRIVVDDAYARAECIATKLAKARDGVLRDVADRLRQIAGTERPLAVARLRGGIFRGDGWARIPSQPAVITSTVDQLGSRLLFRGYGRNSTLTAPIFAGLAANDSLVLLDEAHCSVPFLQTLRAIGTYRGARWAAAPIPTPFCSAVLSATPPVDIPAEAVFPGAQWERALDHPVLHRRLHASKCAELTRVKVRSAGPDDPLVAEAVRRASAFVGHGKRRVGVMVNRVRTAEAVAAELRAAAGDDADVVLLTGRMRPFERDALVDRWKPYLRADAPEDVAKPIVLVSTQCLEVGADFSFDALVSEAASLDALRQRFGRLHRLGLSSDEPQDEKTVDAMIVIREHDANPEKAEPDRIYGSALARTWQLLESHAKDGAIDFGVEAIQRELSDVDDLSPYLAPTADAPVLLPAHLDMLCQTAPRPKPEPDVSLFLHGMQGSAPEVRVVWRADLAANRSHSWIETIALCPPVSGEMLAVPIYRLTAFLNGLASSDDSADIEGTGTEEGAGMEDESARRESRTFLLWRGRDRSMVTCDADDIAPGDVVVVPTEYGIQGLGHSAPAQALGKTGLDLWEPALMTAGRPAAVRLHPAVLAPWSACPAVQALLALAEAPESDRSAVLDGVDAVLNYAPDSADARGARPDWWLSILRTVRSGRLEEHPDKGLVLFARGGVSHWAEEQDLFADDDDLTSVSGREVSLNDHCALVARTVERLARLCLPDEHHRVLQLAAQWHDAGKLDERFQILLHQGDELAALASDSPLAKSSRIPTSPERRRFIREASGLPVAFRHEMLSTQLAEQHAPSLESPDAHGLLLHLIASHHGHARPFAPVSPDGNPPPIAGSLGGVQIDMSVEERSASLPQHRADSGIPDRFWGLVRRHGWWGLAYLEALVRLSDWYASGLGPQSGEQGDNSEAPDHELERHHADRRPVHTGRQAPGSAMRAEAASGHDMALPGLDGANPLGFLAALGTLVAVQRAGAPDARLRWQRGAAWVPVIEGLPTTTRVVYPMGDDRDESATAEEFAPATVEGFSGLVAAGLRGRDVLASADREREAAQKAFEAAEKNVRVKRTEIRRRGLSRAARTQATAAEVAPLECERDRLRERWLAKLAAAVPRPELALGKRIDCTSDEYRRHASAFLVGAQPEGRETIDLLAAFGTDAYLSENGDTIAPTPFCFITGSGHQYFLDTVRQLVGQVSAHRVAETLFKPWSYDDEGLSMRWDPIEDRRYALMDRDPTASGNKARTMWMANLLAYRGLGLFPAAARRGPAVTGWVLDNDGVPSFTWPIWEFPASPDVIRTLLQLRELMMPQGGLSELRARGVLEAFRARRIKVGSGANYKLNFTPARAV